MLPCQGEAAGSQGGDGDGGTAGSSEFAEVGDSGILLRTVGSSDADSSSRSLELKLAAQGQVGCDRSWAAQPQWSCDDAFVLDTATGALLGALTYSSRSGSGTIL